MVSDIWPRGGSSVDPPFQLSDSISTLRTAFDDGFARFRQVAQQIMARENWTTTYRS